MSSVCILLFEEIRDLDKTFFSLSPSINQLLLDGSSASLLAQLDDMWDLKLIIKEREY
jgi:hypothetical protein